MNALIKNLLRLCYPECCEVCGRTLADGEEAICSHCATDFPRLSDSHRDELTQKLLDPALPFVRAEAMMEYVGGSPYTHFIKHAKYNSRPVLARRLGEIYARELIDSDFFNGIDFLQPVPIHWTRRLSRGFNQSEEICRGISEATGLPLTGSLRVKRHATQTRKSAVERRKNAVGTMSVVCPEPLMGKHLLVVDDVITTGSTMLEVMRALHASVPGIRISLLALASARK